MEKVRGIFIVCAWLAALTEDTDGQVAAEQMFIVLSTVYADFVATI